MRIATQSLGIIFLFTLISCSSNSIQQGASKPTTQSGLKTAIEPVRVTPQLVIDSGGHQGYIHEIFFSQDNATLYSISSDKTIQTWDVDSGERMSVWRGHLGNGDLGKLYAGALSPDGLLLAVAGYTGSLLGKTSFAVTIRLLNAKTGEVLRLLEGHTGVVNALAFSPDSRTLLSGGSDNTARLWNIKTGSLLHTLKGHSDFIYGVAFSPTEEGGSQRVATASLDKTVKLWNASNGQLLKTLSGHKDRINAIAFTPNGNFLLSGSSDNTIRLWDGRTGDFIKVLAQQENNIYTLSISPDSKQVLAGKGCCNPDSPDYIYEIPSGKILQSFLGHRGNTVTATAYSSNGLLVASAGSGVNEIKIWNPDNGKVHRVLHSNGFPKRMVGWNKEGTKIGWGNEHFEHHGELHYQLNLPNKLGASMQMGAELNSDTGNENLWSRDIKRIDNISVKVVDVNNSPTELRILHGNKTLHKIIRGSTDGYRHHAFTLTPNGKTVISSGDNGSLNSYSTRSGEKLHDFMGHTSSIYAISPSPDGRYLLTGSEDQTLNLWDLANLPKVDTTKIDPDIVNEQIAFWEKAGFGTFSYDITVAELKKNGRLLYLPAKVKPILTIFPAKNGEWVAWTPEGFYDASPGADRFVGWHVNRGEDKKGDFYSANQFRRYLYRPDIIAKAVAYGSSSRAIAEAGLSDITVTDLIERAPADIQIAAIQPVDGQQLEVTIKIGTNQVNPPERITIFVNGAQQLSQQQRQLKRVKPGDTLKYLVNAQAKENLIQAMVENRWAETSDQLRFTQSDWKEEQRPSRTLFVSAIGINRYPNLDAEQQLTSPGLDAENIVKQFLSISGKLFDKVEVKLITQRNNDNITHHDIEKLLQQQAERTNSNDTSIVFLAGHGVTDSLGNYHFVTADTEVNSLSSQDLQIKQGTSFDWQKLHQSLDAMLGKRLVIVDTCQAGSVISNSKPNIQRLVKDVHDTNAIIYSGTSRQQLGQETDQGGVFTTAIINGIKGNAEYKNNQLLFEDLQRYVTLEVPKLNRVIAYRSLKLVSSNFREKEKMSNETVDNFTQTPVAVIPNGLKEFVFFQK